MREIKFRAWDKEKKRMVNPNQGDFIGWHAPSNWDQWYELMQYTGLKDKNGKEIYEGDIIEVTSELLTNLGRTRTGVMSATYYEVLWREEGWGKKVLRSGQLVIGSVTDGIKISAKYATVCGNIYENPDLLPKAIESTESHSKAEAE